MADDFGLKIGIEGEKQFKQALREIKENFKLLKSEMNLATSAFDKNEQSVESLTSKGEVLNKQIDEQKKKIETLETALKNAGESFGDADKRTKEWQVQLNNAQAELNKMERELKDNDDALDKVADGMDDAEKQTEQFYKALDQSGKTAETAKARLQKAADVAKKVGVAIGAAVAAIGAAVVAAGRKLNECVDVYAAFDDSMKQVAATMGMTAEEIEGGSESYKKMEKAAKDAGASTKFTAAEAAEALNYLALAGYDAEKATAALPTVLNLAAAGDMDLAYASDIVTDSMAALNLKVSDLTSYSDKMAKTAQSSNTSIAQLGEAVLICGGQATLAGMDVVEMNTALGVLADNGMKGSEGGTQLRNVLKNLYTPTSAASKAMQTLGIVTSNADGTLRDAQDILQDLSKSMAGLSEEGRMDAMARIFDTRTIAAANAMIKDSGARWDELSGKITNSKDAAQNMAETMESGLAGTQRTFESAVEGMQIEVGAIFAPIKEGILAGSTDILSTFIADLQNAEGDFSKVGEAVGTMLSGFIAMFNTALPEITNMGIQVLSMLGNAIMENLPIIVESASNIISSLLEGLIQALPALGEGASQLLMALVQAIVDNLPALVNGAIAIVTALANGLAEALPTLIPAIVEAVMLITTTLAENAPMLMESGLALLQGLAQGLIAAIPVLIESLPALIEAMVAYLVQAIPQIVAIAPQMLMELGLGLIQAIPQVLAAIPEIIMSILNGLCEGIPQMSEVGRSLMTGLWNGISSLMSSIRAKVQSFISNMVAGIKSVLGIHSPSTVFEGIGENMGLGLEKGFAAVMDSAKRDMQNSIPTDFAVDMQASVMGTDKMGAAAQAFNITIPLAVDGITLTRIISQIQWSQNAVTVRNLGTV